ncbi:MAG: 2OG-Fe(II) oxygenase [Alphaproteobacteria bacterium]|nr:2OG-Fe(II) oxygenase [Alphaproteobacteria bacterium]MDP6515211.1 2OG-Fe(II) oxygenase [Alphaproteobacteria bacterium]
MARGEAIEVDRGEAVIFPVHERPGPDRRGMPRVTIRHGVSRTAEGERITLGGIFHDAE